MSVKEHKERILAICATFSGVNGTAKGSVRSLSGGNMPAFTVSAGQATHVLTDSETLQTVRQYNLKLLAYSIDAGLEFEAEEIVEPFYPLVEQAFTERVGLYLADAQSDALDGVQTAQVISDSGFVVLDFAEIAFAGCEWIIQVTYITNIQQGW